MKLVSPVLQNVGQDDVSFGYKLPSAATNVTVEIYNEQGALIRTINVDEENFSEGDHKLSWDFSDDNGTKVPNL